MHSGKKKEKKAECKKIKCRSLPSLTNTIIQPCDQSHCPSDQVKVNVLLSNIQHKFK